MKFIFQKENVERRHNLKKLVIGISDIKKFDTLLNEIEQSNFDMGIYLTKRKVADKLEELDIRLIDE